MSAERIPSSAQNNTSGQGKDAVLPEELGGLNWPAFFLHFIWGIGNKTYIALLMFIPFVNLVMPFILLFKGNKWAWANKSWDNVDHFRRVQRKWATATLIIIPVLFFAGGGGFYYGIEQAKTSEPYLASLKQVRQHPQAVKIMGLPITPGWMVTGNLKIGGMTDTADFAYNVSGTKDSGKVYVNAVSTAGLWRLTQLFLVSHKDGKRLSLLGQQPVGSMATKTVDPDLQKGVAIKQPVPAEPAKTVEPAKIIVSEKTRPARNKAPDADANRATVNKAATDSTKQIRERASKGDTKALFKLGTFRLMGIGAQKNASIAFNLFYRAAKAGDAEAQQQLGMMYLEGTGTPLDMKKAEQWMTRSAAQGFEVARQTLQRLGLPLPPVEKKKKPKEKQ